MKRLSNYSFLTILIIFIIHQIIQHALKINIPFLDNYLDPFCFGVLCMHAYSWERKIVFDINKLPYLHLVIAFVFLSITSELILPFFSKNFISDFYDVVAIFLGVGWYYFSYQFFL